MATTHLLDHTQRTVKIELPIDDRAALGQWFRNKRVSMGLTQRQLEEKLQAASKTTVTQGRLSRIERGAAHASVKELEEIGAILGLGIAVTITDHAAA